jgi:type II secretory pathway component PulF
MTLSHWLMHYWPIIVAACGGFFLLFRQWARSPTGRYQSDLCKLGAPVLRNIFSELYLVQSMRVMALSLGNGVSVMDTLASCREVVGNRIFQQFVSSLEICVQDGKGMANGFQSASFVPNIVKQMIVTGEQSGNLSRVLHRIASYYERQLEKRLTVVTKAAEPVMLLVMGVVVGILVSSLILPIFKLSRAVG